jgi:phage-related protein
VHYLCYNLKVMSIGWDVSDVQPRKGGFPVRSFLSNLTQEERATAIALIQLLRERGNALRRPHSGSLGGGLFELRDVQSGVRVFYTFLPGKRAVLLGGMVKKRGDIPAQALKAVRKLCAEARAATREAE